MKKYTKQLIAMLLVICSLASFAMPSVFAVQRAEPDEISGQVTPVVYQFYQTQWKDDGFQDHSAEIKAAYDEGTLNWRYEASSNAYQFRPGVKNNYFSSGSESINYATAEGNWFAVRIQSPGAGRYDLTLTNGVSNRGATVGEVYFIKASAIDSVIGADAAAYAEAMSADPYQENGSTAAYRAFKSAIVAAMEQRESVMSPAYYAESSSSGATATGSFVFEADTEYVAVFKAKQGKEAGGNAHILISSLTASYSANQENLVPTEPVLYQFYQSQWAEDAFQDHSAEIKSAYDEGTMNWRYEASANAYQFRPGVKNNYFSSGSESINYATAEGNWFAVRIQSPGAGRYDLTLTSGMANRGASEGEVYIIKADVIDAALGENAAAYAEAMSADPYQENGSTDAFKAYKAAIVAAVAENNSVLSPSYYATTAHGGATVTGQYIFEADTEYVVVFTSKTAKEAADKAFILMGSLQAKYSEDQENVVPAEPIVLDLYQSQWADDAFNAHTAEIKSAYEAGALNWRFEAAANTYQFRPAVKNNCFKAATKSIEYATMPGNWFAVRIQSPGAGKFDLTFTHGAATRGASVGGVYFVKASAIETALGENASAYIDALAADAYQENGETEAHKAYKAAMNALLENSNAVIYADFCETANASGKTATGRVTLEADTEYLVVFKSEEPADDDANGYLEIGQLTMLYSEDQQTTDGPTGDYPGAGGTEPTLPPAADPNSNVFYQSQWANDAFNAHTAEIKSAYEAGTLNWRFEAAANTYQFRPEVKNNYFKANSKTVVYATAPGNWFAVRIQSPGAGKFDLTLTYGVSNRGASIGAVYFVKASAIETALGENASAYIEALAADAYQENGETEAHKAYKAAMNALLQDSNAVIYADFCESTAAGGRTATGRVTLEADTQYIVVFKSLEAADDNANGFLEFSQLDFVLSADQETADGPTGDYPVIPEAPEEEEGLLPDGSTKYLFYRKEYADKYLTHYKTEEEVGREIVSDEIEKRYNDGELNWCINGSYGGISEFNNYFLRVSTTEAHYYSFRIKSPGTGTYSIDYSHYVRATEKAGIVGKVYVVENNPKKDNFSYIAEECNQKDPIMTLTYKGPKEELAVDTGVYTAFEEGKEYWICLSVEDDDYTKDSNYDIYPMSMTMTRTGDFKPEPGKEPDDGVVYQLFREEYSTKWLHHSNNPCVKEEANARYESGELNWKLEGVGGNVYFSNTYMQVGVSKTGNSGVFRIKSPGEGKYRITLHHFLDKNRLCASVGEIYVMEAPEDTLPGDQLLDKLAREPIATTTFSHAENKTKKASTTGVYNFQKDKEYLVFIYIEDMADSNNETGSVVGYVDRMVMKRIGEYEAPEEHQNIGGIASAGAVRNFRTNNDMAVSVINGHDYVGLATYGGTLMIYDLDEWRLVDEVYTGVGTPRGMAVDQDGNYWVAGDETFMYCYNPYTYQGFATGKISNSGSFYEITCGDDGYLYVGTRPNIYRIDPRTLEFKRYDTLPSWAKMTGGVVQKGDYLYAGVNGDQNNLQVIVLHKETGKIVKSYDMSHLSNKNIYVQGMRFIDENLLWVGVPGDDIGLVNIETGELITSAEFGINKAVQRSVSEIVDGKCYMVSSTDGLCVYDTATGKAEALGGDLVNAKTHLRSGGQNFVTIDDDRLPNPCLITYSGMSDTGLNLTCYNIEDKKVVNLLALVEPAYAIGQGVKSVFTIPGTGEVYFSAMYDSPVQVYDIASGELVRGIKVFGQSDSSVFYQDTLYIGNYNLGALTRVGEGGAGASETLFRLNDNNFDQARVTSLSAGDNKIVAGTIPDSLRYGGLIAWYDLDTELTYVVTGPNPEDVFYAKASKIMETNEWYSAVTHELVNMEEEWDQDQYGTGEYHYFKGPIPYQSITSVVYRDGLIFGTASICGGTSAADRKDLNAKLFVYDTEKLKMVGVYDLRDYFSGLPSSIPYYDALVADPDVSNKYWGAVSETLFSFTYDKETGKINFKKELSFSMTSIRSNCSWSVKQILFNGEYMYYMFGARGGLCRINKNDPSQYEQLLCTFDSKSQFPSSYGIGDDGELYYATSGNPNLYVLNLDPTEEDFAEGKAVQDLIDLISDEVTLDDRAAIEAARAAWDAMAPKNQPYVNNYQKLADAEVKLLALRIENLGEITLEDEQELISIREKYKTLEIKVRTALNLSKLSVAESKMSVLVAGRMVDQINAIGEVTLDKQGYIRSCREAYNLLSRYEKTLVTNIDALEAAEARLSTLLLSQVEADAVEKLIDEIGFVFFNNSKIKIAREAYDKLDAETKAWVENYKTLTSAETLLIVEFVVAGLIVAGGAAITVIALRKKASKKKATAAEE